MTKLFRNKYRIESIRLKNWDYSTPGYYFVTVCTKNRIDYFGYIKNNRMCLNKYGATVCQEIYKTPIMRENVIIDEFIVMPNHIHLIVKIINFNHVETQCIVSPQCKYKNKFGPQYNNLSSIMRGLKSIITKQIHQYGLIDFKWQSLFYEHIIRNEDSLNRIRNYIKYNPIKWNKDRNNKK